MRASELLGRQVLGPTGEDCGEVLDVRLVQDGPLLGAFAAMRIQGFVVGRRRTGARLGYDRHEQQGPLLVRLAVRWWLRGSWFLPWESVEMHDDVIVSLTAERPSVPQL